MAFAPLRSAAVVTPAPDRAFCPHPGTGSNIIAQMAAEAANPALSNVVVHFVNNSPVSLTNIVNRNGQFETNIVTFQDWTGTLISPEWVLTCAHALQGTDGRGGGVDPGEIFFNFGGSTFPDPASAAVAEFFLHPDWELEGYADGNDLALVRLAVPVRGVVDFPRLEAARFLGEYPVVFAGFGAQGTGFTGGTGQVGQLRVGLNVLDDAPGSALLDGSGNANHAYDAYAPTIGLMDFDQAERRPFACNGQPTSAEFALAAFSSMGVENVQSAPVPDPCGGGGTVPGAFAMRSCDFFPGSGDSGGPAFNGPTLPNIPALGPFVTSPATLVGVASFVSKGNQAVGGAIYGNVAGYTLVQPHLAWVYRVARAVAERDSDGDGRNDEAEVLAGSDPYSAPRAPATFVPSPIDVILQGIRVLQERVFGADLTDIEFTSDLRNTDSGRYFDLSVEVDRSRLPVGADVVDPMLNYPTLAENGTAVAGPNETLILRVPNSELAAARAAILSGAWLQISAFEEQVYSSPTRYVDAPTDDAYVGNTSNASDEVVLLFSGPTELLDLLEPGDVLLAESTRAGYQPRKPEIGVVSLVPFLPFKVSSVSIANGQVELAGVQADLNEVLKSGTFLASDATALPSTHELLDPVVENTHTAAEKEARRLSAMFLAETHPDHPGIGDYLAMDAIPWRFNDVEITPAMRLSGQVLLRSSGLRVQFSFRNFALKSARIGIDAGITASMVLETTGTNHNVGAPIAETQRQLARIPLPQIPIVVAGFPITIGPTFVLSVGAEANAPSGLIVPFETSVLLGTEIGWAEGQTFSTPIKEFSAPQVSDPTVFDAVGGSARAWAEARLEINVGAAAGAVSTGPSLAVRAEAALEVKPLENPWWTLDVGADLVAGFQLRLLGLDVARVETSQEIATYFHRDAGGPLLPGGGGSGGGGSGSGSGGGSGGGGGGGGGGGASDIGPKAGQDLRWALAFAPPGASVNYTKGFIAPMADGDIFLGGSAAVPSFLGVVSAEGRVEWMHTFPFGAKPVAGTQLPDGSLLVAGAQGVDWWVAGYDRLGNRQWVRSHRMQADLQSMAVGTSSNGAPEIYLAGFQSLSSVRESDPVVLKLDAAGNVLWNKVYRFNGDDEVYSVRVLRDGHLLLSGNTDTRIGTGFTGASGNGLVMKLSPAGDLEWATAVPGRWGMSLRDTAEGPDGSIYAVGYHSDLVTDLYPSILLAKFKAGGQLIDHVTVGEDADAEDVLPNAGDTPYDGAVHCAWVGDSLVVAGNTGLGATMSAWVMRVTDELGVRWMSAFDGPGGAHFGDLAVTDGGLLTMGYIDHPWPGRFDGRTPAWLVSLPWEGILRFHPTSGIRSTYLQPHVFLSSENENFIATSTGSDGRPYALQSAAATFNVSNAVATAGSTVQPGTLTTFATARLDRLEPSVISNYDEWLAYYQLSGTGTERDADLDGDGFRNLWEFFSGGDPTTSSTNVPVGLVIAYDREAGVVTIDFARALMATGQPYRLLYSPDLERWFPANVTQEILSTDATRQWIRLTVAEPHIYQAFFRLELP